MCEVVQENVKGVCHLVTGTWSRKAVIARRREIMVGRRRMVRVLCVLLWLLLRPDYAHATHITGTFNTREFFRFLIKFGFQKTDRHRLDSYGYIFGNVTARSDFDSPITLAILDRGNFLEYYGNRTLTNKSTACAYMFDTLKQSSYDPHCNEEGKDFLR